MRRVLPDDPYFAGFFDADGSVSIRPAPGYTLRVKVTQVAPEVLLLFKARFGGTVAGPYENAGLASGSRPIWRWEASATAAEAFLRAVGPYLIVKRERAEIGLELRRVCGRHTHAIPQSKRPALRRAREDCFQRLAALNQTGPRVAAGR